MGSESSFWASGQGWGPGSASPTLPQSYHQTPGPAEGGETCPFKPSSVLLDMKSDESARTWKGKRDEETSNSEVDQMSPGAQQKAHGGIK